MTTHRILITAVGGNIGQGIIKALRAAKRRYYIVGIDMEPLSAGFSMVDSYYRTPRTADRTFLRRLRSIAQKERLEAIYVCSPSELEYFSVNQIKIEQELGLAIFVNPPDVVRLGSDKLRTAQFLRDAHLSYPETVLATDKKAVEDLIRRYGFPLIMKPRFGFTAKNVFSVNSRKEIESIQALVPDMILQRYLPDFAHEYTAGTLSGKDKKVFATIVLHRELNQGTTYRTELVEDQSITKQVINVVNSLGAVGSCNLQFRLLGDQVFVFEINPRFSGTCGIRYLYGFNDAEMIFEAFRLGLKIRQPKLRPGVVLRYWNEVFIPAATFRTLIDESRSHCGIQTVFKNSSAERPSKIRVKK
jgi:carbamoyl-phosphate synthase large subunit